MRKEPKYRYAIRLFHYWMGRLNLPKPIPAIKDNRMDCSFAVSDWETKENICLKYHTRRIGQQPKFYIISDILHEIGHLINNMPYGTRNNQVISEREAERFSIKMMKKHYPKQFKLVIKRMTEKQSMVKLMKKDRLYFDAYFELPEYKATIR